MQAPRSLLNPDLTSSHSHERMAPGKKRGCGGAAGAQRKPPKRTKNHRTAQDPFEASRDDDDVQYEVEQILHKVCLRRLPALPLTIVVCSGSTKASGSTRCSGRGILLRSLLPPSVVRCPHLSLAGDYVGTLFESG